MSRSLPFVFFLATIVFCPADAQVPPLPAASGNIPAATNPTPPFPPSPVNFFRQLLTMSPVERDNSLASRPPEIRERILAKIREYQVLAPDERELRLRTTELRWWLTPLLSTPSKARAARLALVPEELRGLVEARLRQWDILPPPLQQEFLTNAQALHYFAHVPVVNELAGDAEQKRVSNQFNQFYELTPAEKQQTLDTLSEAERVAMEKTLQTFGQLPTGQRAQCVRNYAKFAGMSAAERAEFLKNARKWSQMSQNERQIWRDLVAQVPIWPPLPPRLPPPLPPLSPKISAASVATNVN